MREKAFENPRRERQYPCRRHGSDAIRQAPRLEYEHTNPKRRTAHPRSKAVAKPNATAPIGQLQRPLLLFLRPFFFSFSPVPSSPLPSSPFVEKNLKSMRESMALHSYLAPVMVTAIQDRACGFHGCLSFFLVPSSLLSFRSRLLAFFLLSFLAEFGASVG